MSRPEDKALRGRNLSAEPEAEMGRAKRPACRMSILAPKRKILGLGAKPQLKYVAFPYGLRS